VDVVNRDFYTTLAQVLPVLLLALMFDSGFLARLRQQSRADVLFWTKPRVRAYILFVLLLTVGSTAVALFVLAGLLSDTLGLRIALIAAAVIVLGTLLTRVGIDVIQATAETPKN
jgi:MFS family permease